MADKPRRSPTLLDRVLLGATVTLLSSGAAACLLGVFTLVRLAF